MLSILVVAGCAGPATTDAAQGALTLTQTGDGANGTYALDGEQLSFEVHSVGTGTYDVTVRLHGMVLTAVVEPNGGVANLDGFATNGGETQIIAEDRTILLAFSHALTTRVGDAAGATGTLADVANLWSDTADTVPLQRQVLGARNRSWTSICGYAYTYQYATHDCWSYNDWDASSTMIPHVGDRTGSTYYWVNGSWTTATQDHRAYTYEWGDCYGSCGADCPSGGQILTWDCLDHDSCVRNGHSIASFWCDDEFTSASDDYLFAPSCAGT